MNSDLQDSRADLDSSVDIWCEYLATTGRTLTYRVDQEGKRLGAVVAAAVPAIPRAPRAQPPAVAQDRASPILLARGVFGIALGAFEMLRRGAVWEPGGKPSVNAGLHKLLTGSAMLRRETAALGLVGALAGSVLDATAIAKRGGDRCDISAWLRWPPSTSRSCAGTDDPDARKPMPARRPSRGSSRRRRPTRAR